MNFTHNKISLKNFTIIVKWKCELFDWAGVERGTVTDQLTALFGDSSVTWFLKVKGIKSKKKA